MRGRVRAKAKSVGEGSEDSAWTRLGDRRGARPPRQGLPPARGDGRGAWAFRGLGRRAPGRRARGGGVRLLTGRVRMALPREAAHGLGGQAPLGSMEVGATRRASVGRLELARNSRGRGSRSRRCGDAFGQRRSRLGRGVRIPRGRALGTGVERGPRARASRRRGETGAALGLSAGSGAALLGGGREAAA